MSKDMTYFDYNSYRAKANTEVRKVYHLSNSVNPYCLVQNKYSPDPREVQARLTYSHGYIGAKTVG